MHDTLDRLGVFPYLLLGAALLVLGVMATDHIVNNFWPFDVTRLDLVRASALDQANPSAMLDAANGQILLAFLASVMVAVTGLVLPLVYYTNVRFDRDGESPPITIVLRQALLVGLWLAFCVWLQMNRSLGLAVALLVAAVLATFEILLQVRRRASSIRA
jgi:hypothetical protein